MLVLVHKLLLCVEEGIAFSSIHSYGHLKGIGVQKDATYFFLQTAVKVRSTL